MTTCIQKNDFNFMRPLRMPEWGYKSYFASYNPNSRGVAILFNSNLGVCFLFFIFNEKGVEGYFRILHNYLLL